MSPIPADDLPPEEIKLPKRQAVAAKPTNGVAEVSLPEETLRAGMPIIRSRVVYLGPGDYHSISFGGQVNETYIEDREGPVERRDRDGHDAEGNVVQGKMRHYVVLKEATDNTGTTQYDFSLRDSRGRFIDERIMPRDASQKLAGRPFTWCEHVGHLRRFVLARDERGEKLYEVMCKPEQVVLLQNHIRMSERARKANTQLYSEIKG